MEQLQDNAGFNITGSKLQLVELNFENSKLLVENVDEQFFPSSLNLSLTDDDFLSILHESFNEFTSKKPIYSKRASFALSDEFFKIFEFPVDPLLTNEDIKSQINWEIKTLLPGKLPSDFSLQYLSLKYDGAINKNSILVYLIEKRILKLLRRFCDDNNRELKTVDNSHVISNSLLFVEDNKIDEVFISVYVYESSISLLVYKSTELIYRKFKFFDVVYDIESIVAAEIENLSELGIGKSNFSNIYLAGEILPDKLNEQLNGLFEKEIIKFNPFEKFSLAPSLNENKFVNEFNNSFTAPLGIALRLF